MTSEGIPAAWLKGKARAYMVPDGFDAGRYVLDPIHIGNDRHIVMHSASGRGFIPRPRTPWRHNDVLYSWGAAAVRALTQPGSNYTINAMYLEFKNSGGPVSPPTFDRTGGIEYYLGLASSGDTDYLRVPLVATTLDVSDPALFTDVNRMTMFAMSNGITGINGKAFSDSAGSTVYGGALVSIINPADKTTDIVFSRFYFLAADQQTKLSTSQIGIEWQVTLE